MKTREVELHIFEHMRGGCPKCAAWATKQRHCPGCGAHDKEHLHCECQQCGYKVLTEVRS